MTRRGYSKQFPAGKDRASTGYVLNGIPVGLWKRAQAKAKRDGVTMRSVLLSLIRDWVLSPAAAAPAVGFDVHELQALQRALMACGVDRTSGPTDADGVALVKIGILLKQEGAI